MACLPSVALRAQQGTVVDGVVAVVGKSIIKKSDVENGYVQYRLRQGSANASVTRCDLLENMLLSKLLLHKGEVDSVEVTDEQVEQEVQYYLKNYVRQYGSREALRDATGYTYDEMHDIFFDQLKNRRISQEVEYKLTQNVSVTPREVVDFYNKVKDSLPEIPESYELSEIVISPEVSEVERDRVRTELSALRERVLKGEKFSMLATLYSQDPGSTSKGGELGFFTRGDMVGEVEAAAFALKPGEVSPVVESKFGFHILQLIERRGNAVNARHILMIPKVSSDDLLKARMRLDSLRSEERRAGNTPWQCLFLRGRQALFRWCQQVARWRRDQRKHRQQPLHQRGGRRAVPRRLDGGHAGRRDYQCRGVQDREPARRLPPHTPRQADTSPHRQPQRRLRPHRQRRSAGEKGQENNGVVGQDDKKHIYTHRR